MPRRVVGKAKAALTYGSTPEAMSTPVSDVAAGTPVGLILQGCFMAKTIALKVGETITNDRDWVFRSAYSGRVAGFTASGPQKNR
jgi:hypothetical protein